MTNNCDLRKPRHTNANDDSSTPAQTTKTNLALGFPSACSLSTAARHIPPLFLFGKLSPGAETSTTTDTNQILSLNAYGELVNIMSMGICSCLAGYKKGELGKNARSRWPQHRETSVVVPSLRK